jgi:hypothetical protein
LIHSKREIIKGIEINQRKKIANDMNEPFSKPKKKMGIQMLAYYCAKVGVIRGKESGIQT